MIKTESDTNQYRLPTTGERITIQGLVSASHHNGKVGKVMLYDKELHRYKVKLMPTEKKKESSNSKATFLSVKPANILLSDDNNKKDWDDRLVHVFIPCHISDYRRHEQFRQCIRSLVVQYGRCRIFVGVSGETESFRQNALDTLRTAAALPQKDVSNHHQWFVVTEETETSKSQFQHYQSLLSISMALNPYAWLMFLDNDDMYHPERIHWFQESARKLQDEKSCDGFYCGSKLLIDDKKAREKFGPDNAIALDLFLNLDESLDDIVQVAATEEENHEKDVSEYFDFCIRSSVLNRFISLTPRELLAHLNCDVRFVDCVQKLSIKLRYHPTEEWLLMHYRIRHWDRHQLFLNRDTQTHNNAMMAVSIAKEDRNLADETGIDATVIAFLRKDLEESVIMMVERDDTGLEHRRKMFVPHMDETHGYNIGSRLWEATCEKYSSCFTDDLARKNRQWCSASNQQEYNLEEDKRHDGNF